MPDKVRAKFFVIEVKDCKNEKMAVTAQEVHLSAVYSGDADSENRKFWEATPSGQITMRISNPGAFDYFVPGEQYYIDFIPADPSKS